MTVILKRASVEGNCVLLMLGWLGQTPESLVTNHTAPTTPETILPRTHPGRILRWTVPALHAAPEEKRVARGMTWKPTRSLGSPRGCSPGWQQHVTSAFPA
jgi:hypothetical protein